MGGRSRRGGVFGGRCVGCWWGRGGRIEGEGGGGREREMGVEMEVEMGRVEGVGLGLGGMAVLVMGPEMRVEGVEDEGWVVG